MTLKLRSIEAAPRGEVRTYAHPILGDLRFVLRPGTRGGCDVIDIGDLKHATACWRSKAKAKRLPSGRGPKKPAA